MVKAANETIAVAGREYRYSEAEAARERKRPRAYYGRTSKLSLDEFAAALFVANEERAGRGEKPLTDAQIEAVIGHEFKTPDGAKPSSTVSFLRNKYNSGRMVGLARPVLSIRYLPSGHAAEGNAQATPSDCRRLIERAQKYKIDDPRVTLWKSLAVSNNPYPTLTTDTSTNSAPPSGPPAAAPSTAGSRGRRRSS